MIMLLSDVVGCIRSCMARQFGFRRVVVGLMIWIGGVGGVAHAATSAEGQAIEDATASAFWWGDFNELERLNAIYQRPGQRTQQGFSKLAYFRSGLDRVLKGQKGDTDAYFDELERLTLEWANQYPRSALAHVLHAGSLHAHAWSFRGTGYANTIMPQALDQYVAYEKRAADYLAAHTEVALKDSRAHAYLIEIGRALNWTFEQTWAVAQSGLALNSDDDALYFSVLTRTLPKWGGSAIEVDRYVNLVLARTQNELGMEWYARLYSDASDSQFQNDLFTDSLAQWPKMKQGFTDRLSRYQAPITLNRIARFACLARDKPTLVAALAKVGPKPDLDAWGTNSQRNFQACKQWAATP